MPIKTYVDALQEVFRAYPSLERGVAVSQVILSLPEPYLSSFLLVNDLDRDKAKDIGALLKEFGEATFVENETLASSLFSKRNQLPQEDANEYGNVLFTLARNAFSKTFDNEQLKRRVLERFIFGLREPVGC